MCIESIEISILPVMYHNAAIAIFSIQNGV